MKRKMTGVRPVETMARIDLPYVQRVKDRYGKSRHYYRRPGFKSVRLPGKPGSAEFMEAYAAAGDQRKQLGLDRIKPGTMSALLQAYYSSAEFRGLLPQTRANYKNILGRFAEKLGHIPANKFDDLMLKDLMDGMASKPGAATTLMKRLRTVFNFAVDRRWIAVNPAMRVKPPKSRSEGFIPWSEDDIAKFAERWPATTKEGLALALFLCTGQRRSDVVPMGRQHVKNDMIYVVQAKTGEKLWIPLHPELKAILDALPLDDLTFLKTEYGRPFTVKGFGAWFKARSEAAGLRDRTAHGLRKAAARRLAEAGCSVHEIGAITGHRGLKGLEPYTRSARQPHLAKAAMAHLRGIK
jgi:integrase